MLGVDLQKGVPRKPKQHNCKGKTALEQTEALIRCPTALQGACPQNTETIATELLEVRAKCLDGIQNAGNEALDSKYFSSGIKAL